jgi:hypothetical protein
VIDLLIERGARLENSVLESDISTEVDTITPDPTTTT